MQFTESLYFLAAVAGVIAGLLLEGSWFIFAWKYYAKRGYVFSGSSEGRAEFKKWSNSKLQKYFGISYETYLHGGIGLVVAGSYALHAFGVKWDVLFTFLIASVVTVLGIALAVDLYLRARR